MQDSVFNIKSNASNEILEGVSACAELIRPIYGGAGVNVMVETKLYPYHAVYNDAQSIVQSIKTKSKAHKIGVDLIKELCDKADKVSGDARKTTILLTEEILKESLNSSMHKLELKRELDKLIPLIEEEIDKSTTPITLNEVKNVAKTASESEEIGTLFQEIYNQIGENGIINIEGSGTYETSYKITHGVKFEGAGMLSPEMINTKETRKSIYENPRVLVTKKKIATDDNINPLLNELSMSDNRNLVIFTQDMDSNVASLLINLHKNGQFNILIIKAPVLWRDEVFEDFAKCVGAKIVEDSTGVSFKNLSSEHLGTCGRIEVDAEDTVIIGTQDITDHCKALQEKGDETSMLRLSWLVNKSAILKLGANSETDLSYKRLKANDANRSTYLALKYGVVRGGGLCLYKIAEELFTNSSTEAGKILYIALQAPLKQAMANYGVTHDEYTKLITDDIVDASMVIKRAVRNAIGIASTVITAPALVYIPDKTPEEMAYEVAIKQTNPF